MTDFDVSRLTGGRLTSYTSAMVPATEIGYRGPAACALAAITYRQLDHWDRIGLVQPSITAAHGSGTQRRYSAVDVLCLRVLSLLTARGMLPSSRWPVDAVEIIRLAERDTLAAGVLVLGDDVPAILDAAEVPAYAGRLGAAALIVPLGPLCAGLDGLGE